MSQILFTLKLGCACRVLTLLIPFLGLKKEVRAALRMTDQCKNMLVS